MLILQIVLHRFPIYPLQIQKNIGVKTESGFVPKPL